ncbi:MAG: hypothetical protein GC200_00125 [Tepidisphaera sp.]|nr:hypothetical protein [Tepidisphaera sp.]
MRVSSLSRAFALAALAGTASLSFGQLFTGPSSSQAPYLVPVPGGPSIQSYSILTAGDLVGGYRMEGTPDGLGAYDNGDGTMTVLMNHEFGTTAGITRAHGGTGSFVSRWVVNTTPGPNFLQVISGSDLDQSVVTTSNGAGTANSFSRFCSADLAPQTAFFNSASGLGSASRIYLNGEESGSNGRAMAHVVDINGSNTGVGFQLNAFDGLGAWENILAHPNTGNQTLLMANSDGARNGVYAYVGSKTNTGSAIDRAGLTGGTTYSIQVSVNGSNIASEDRLTGLNGSLSGNFALTPITRDANGAVTGGNTGTTFLRPEDGAWDASKPNDYYFVTTDRYDQNKDGVGSQVGRSRLWRMRYSDVNNPTAGGTIEALLDGSESQQMLDNICVVPGTDGHTRILALEDVGGNDHNGKVWMYDTATDQLTLVAQHFASNGDIGAAATAPFNNDEEFSGIIDARDTLGLGWFLVVDQQHYGVSGGQVEGGQFIAFYLPSAIPAPSAMGLMGLAGLAGLRRRR